MTVWFLRTLLGAWRTKAGVTFGGAIQLYRDSEHQRAAENTNLGADIRESMEPTA